MHRPNGIRRLALPTKARLIIPVRNIEWNSPLVALTYLFTVGTPAYGNGPFTPQTPGTMYESNYSPYQASPGGYQSENFF